VLVSEKSTIINNINKYRLEFDVSQICFSKITDVIYNTIIKVRSGKIKTTLLMRFQNCKDARC